MPRKIAPLAGGCRPFSWRATEPPSQSARRHGEEPRSSTVLIAAVGRESTCPASCAVDRAHFSADDQTAADTGRRNVILAARTLRRRRGESVIKRGSVIAAVGKRLPWKRDDTPLIRRQAYPEHRPLAGPGTGRGHIATVQFGQLLDDGQPQSKATMAAGGGTVGLAEMVEQTAENTRHVAVAVFTHSAQRLTRSVQQRHPPP